MTKIDDKDVGRSASVSFGSRGITIANEISAGAIELHYAKAANATRVEALEMLDSCYKNGAYLHAAMEAGLIGEDWRPFLQAIEKTLEIYMNVWPGEKDFRNRD